MRIKFETPSRNQRRIIEKFLWLPTFIKDELRWLEKSSYEEKFDGTRWIKTVWIDP